MTAGRSLAWPLIIEKIRERPWEGYGRQAMLRTGVATYLYETLGEIFPHPHNAYLEIVFDNGIIGAADRALVLCLDALVFDPAVSRQG